VKSVDFITFWEAYGARKSRTNCPRCKGYVTEETKNIRSGNLIVCPGCYNEGTVSKVGLVWKYAYEGREMVDEAIAGPRRKTKPTLGSGAVKKIDPSSWVTVQAFPYRFLGVEGVLAACPHCSKIKLFQSKNESCDGCSNHGTLDSNVSGVYRYVAWETGNFIVDKCPLCLSKNLESEKTICPTCERIYGIGIFLARNHDQIEAKKASFENSPNIFHPHRIEACCARCDEIKTITLGESRAILPPGVGQDHPSKFTCSCGGLFLFGVDGANNSFAREQLLTVIPSSEWATQKRPARIIKSIEVKTFETSESLLELFKNKSHE
jgi:hypothetical protein